MILAVELTTQAVEKEPEKNSSLTKNQTLYLQWLDAMLYIHGAYQANWRAGHCEFIRYPMVEMTRIKIYKMNHTVKFRK